MYKMNNFIGLDTRNRRNLNATFAPIHVPVSNYSTKAQTKESINDTYNTMFPYNLHLIPDPLKKNLADSVITEKKMTKTKEYTPKEVKKPPNSQVMDFYPKFKNIISGVINVMGAMFQWRDSSPASQYYDCFDGDYIENSDEPMSGSVSWQSANRDVQNKNAWAQGIFDDNNWNSEIMSNCSPALTDDQINQVCLLLNGESNYIQVPNSKAMPFESGSADEFEDAFCPDDLTLSTDSYLEYHSPLCYQEELFNSYASNVKSTLNKESIDCEPIKIISPHPGESDNVVSDSVTEMSLEADECENHKSTEIDKRLSKQTNISASTEKLVLATDVSESELSESYIRPDMIKEGSPKSDMVRAGSPKSDQRVIVSTIKDSVISSCEDKLNRLKALLKSKCAKQKQEDSDNSILTDSKTENIVSDTVFGDEINIPSTACLRLAEPFNEVTGKFYSSSVESDDSFQIVFTDDARSSRCRIPSECESEDSFIVFEESPDGYYISDDVFGNVQINDNSDSDISDSEDDSGCESRLCPDFSRTVEDLTDCKLYDEVDSSTLIGQHYNHSKALLNEDNKSGMDRPHKKVHFSSEPPKVHVMRVWAFAARQARIGEWEQHARDRERFKSRINDVEMAISWVLKPQHRRLVMFQRFMPWWNAQKRKEQEEKKQKELEQQIKQQQENLQILECEEMKQNTNENVNEKNEEVIKQIQLTKDRLQNETLTKHRDLENKEITTTTENSETGCETTEADEDLHSDDERNLDIDKKKALDRENNQGTELDDNQQLGNELKMSGCNEDRSQHSVTDQSSESDR